MALTSVTVQVSSSIISGNRARGKHISMFQICSKNIYNIVEPYLNSLNLISKRNRFYTVCSLNESGGSRKWK